MIVLNVVMSHRRSPELRSMIVKLFTKYAERNAPNAGPDHAAALESLTASIPDLTLRPMFARPETSRHHAHHHDPTGRGDSRVPG